MSPACPIPARRRASLLLGAVLIEQGFSAEQSAEWVRKANEALEPDSRPTSFEGAENARRLEMAGA